MPKAEDTCKLTRRALHAFRRRQFTTVIQAIQMMRPRSSESSDSKRPEGLSHPSLF